MNIFAVDSDPEIAAISLRDNHVSKMTLETAQILCTAAILKGLSAPYRKTHQHSKIVRWVLASRANAQWLVRHGEALGREFVYRYGHPHKSDRVIREIGTVLLSVLPDVPMTPFVQVIDEDLIGEDPVMAYRRYYVREKLPDLYTRREPPEWALVAFARGGE